VSRAILLVLALLGSAVLSACQPPACARPADGAWSAEGVARCLPADASAAQALALLGQGGGEFASQAADVDVLPGGGAEIVLALLPGDATPWDPRGQLAVLQRPTAPGQGWTVHAGLSAEPGVTPLGEPWSNWRYALGPGQDLSGDGLAEVLVRRSWNSGHNAAFADWMLISGGSGALRVLWREAEPDPLVTVQLDAAARGVRIAHRVGFAEGRTLERRLVVDGNALVERSRTVDPPRAAVAALTRAGDALARGGDPAPEALPLLGGVYSYSAGQAPPMSDEAILAEWALLRYAQGLTAHPPADPSARNMAGGTLDLFASAAARRSDTLAQGRLIGAYRSGGCAAVRALLDQQPGLLDQLAAASGGALRFTPAEACAT